MQGNNLMFLSVNAFFSKERVVGQVMRKLRGRGDPDAVMKLIKERLG